MINLKDKIIQRGIERIKDKYYSSKVYDLYYNVRKHYLSFKYPDYEDNEFNCGELKFIWGIKSSDDMHDQPANFYTMNDIDICYDRKSRLYMLGIETAYLFTSKSEELNYLTGLLDKFTEFMMVNGHSIYEEPCLYMSQPSITTCATSIPNLYMQFKMFVNGYKSLYEQSN